MAAAARHPRAAQVRSFMPRWHTFEPGIAQEQRARDELLTRISQWWIDFAMHRDVIVSHLKQVSDMDLAAWMQAHLQSIDIELMWEFGPGIPSGRRLVITPESDYHLRPLVERLLEAAPVMAGWQFLGYRVAEDLRLTRLTVEGRTSRSWEATRFRLSMGDGNLIDLTVSAPARLLAQEAERDLATDQAWIAAENLLGEQLFRTWGGLVSVGEEQPDDLPLEELPAAFQAMRQRLLDALPTDLHADRAANAAWSSIDFTPQPQEDYARREDLLVASSMNLPLFEAAHSDLVFASCRFSHSEIFCYLKIDRDSLPSGQVVQERSDIEQALDARLHPLGLGGTCGGGTGLRYSYIDLALTDYREAVPVIRNILAKHGMPKRSWLLFFDSEWASEWIGGAADSPPPPGIP
jgi:hypothetical protein